jgi:uncharacterized protein
VGVLKNHHCCEAESWREYRFSFPQSWVIILSMRPGQRFEIQTELLPSHPLTAEELDELDHLLLSLDSDDAFILSKLEGYIAGVLCCPVKLKVSDWFPLIWGDMQAYDAIGDDEAMQIIMLTLQHFNHVQSCLQNPDIAYQPQYEIDSDGSPLWEIWAEGFERAMEVGSRGWRKFGAKNLKSSMAGEAMTTLMGIIDLAMNGDMVPPENRDELQRMAPDLIPALTKSIYELNTRGKISAAKDFLIDVQGEIPKVGRNDLCPCGSGKKYKKCHGA